MPDSLPSCEGYSERLARIQSYAFRFNSKQPGFAFPVHEKDRIKPSSLKSYNAKTMPRTIKFLLFCASACLSLSLGAADRRPITETDIYAFQWVANPQISPDGSRVAYVHVNVNQKHDG